MIANYSDRWHHVNAAHHGGVWKVHVNKLFMAFTRYKLLRWQTCLLGAVYLLKVYLLLCWSKLLLLYLSCFGSFDRFDELRSFVWCLFSNQIHLFELDACRFLWTHSFVEPKTKASYHILKALVFYNTQLSLIPSVKPIRLFDIIQIAMFLWKQCFYEQLDFFIYYPCRRSYLANALVFHKTQDYHLLDNKKQTFVFSIVFIIKCLWIQDCCDWG